MKLKVVSSGVLFFLGGSLMLAQQKPKSDTLVKEQLIKEVVLVNVGYTKVKKSAVTGAVASVKSNDIANGTGATVQQSLVGKMAGVDISFGSGAPGSGKFRVDIRGTQTINGNVDPLYIVDGVPISSAAFQLLDPNSFESVDTVKDYGTSAQYGASGGGGIILITTKKGSNRSRPILTYTGQTGVSMRADNKVTLMDSRQWNTWRRSMGLDNPYTNQPYTDADIENLAKINTDWKNLVIRPATFNQHNLEAAGGSDMFTYYTNLGYLDQQGIIRGSSMQRTSLVANLGMKLSPKFSLDVNNNITYGIRNSVSSEGAVNLNNPVVATYLAPPSDLPYLPNGDYNVGSGHVGANALQTMDKRVAKSSQFRIVSGITGIYKFTDHLSAKQLIGIDHRNTNGETFTPPDTYLGSITTPGNKGSLARTNSQISSILNNTSLNYSNTFADIHNISVTGLYEYFGKFIKSFGYTGYGLDNLYTNSPSAILVSANTLPSISGGSTNYHRLAFVGILNYVLNDKYSFNASIRRESASNFGANHKWGTFWGAGAAWQMHKEAFMDGQNYISTFKPRISMGVVGNPQDPEFNNPYLTDKNYVSGSYNNLPTLVPSNPGNPDFRWEKGKEINGGLDFGFFNNRITGSVDVFKRNTTDLYLSKTLSRTTGYGSIDNFNAGELENKGIELQLNADVIKTDMFRWSLFGNYSNVKNKIVSLGEVNEYELGTSIVKVGLPIGTHYMVGWAGVDATNGQPLYYDANGNVTNVYSDSNATANWGSYKPQIFGGFGTEIAYGNFSLNANFRYKAKYFRFNNESYFMENANFSQYNQSAAMLNMWTTPGQITEIQSFNYPRQFSSKDIEDASFLRLQEVRLDYKIPKSAIGDFISGISVFVVGNNLYTWTNWTGLDPDDDNNIAQYEYPFSRTITFGAKINF